MVPTVISHYEILEKLGEGGMGVVHKAQDTKLKRIVALKFLPRYLTGDLTEKERFYHEARAASVLNHPNIATIYEIDEQDDVTGAAKQLFIAMEYVQGKTLKELLKSEPLPLDRVLDMAIQICEGLAAAHEQGIVHRDIKSENIMLTHKGLIKIMDFGLAKVKGATRLTKSGSTLGTAAYMSPEQAQGEEVDQRSDIFSVGVVLYELLSGRLPFRGEHEAALIYSIINEEPQKAARFNEKVTQEIEHIVSKALAKDREERYQHADDLLADLRHERKKLEYAKGEYAAGRVFSFPGAPVSKRRWKIIAPIMAAVVVVAVLCIYLFYPKSTPASAKSRSIAVLPFKNMSDSKEDEYFADGLTEDIITQLSKIGEIDKVVARTSIMQYKASGKSIRNIGRELDVATVLEGSVRRSGNQLRIVAQLIDVSSEGHLWADTYDKEMTQVFAVQSDVARSIAAALKARLSPEVAERIEKKPTGSSEAYQLCLKGRFFWNKRTPSDAQRAIEYYKGAIGIDSNYALAYAGLASTYATMVQYSGPHANELSPVARDFANRALGLDNTSAEAHTVLGSYKTDYEWDWVGAENQFARAIELDPGYATAHQWYSVLLRVLGRFDEAFKEARRALELDPLSVIVNVNLAHCFRLSRQYDKAVDQYKKALELDPNFVGVLVSLASTYDLQNKYDRAIEELEKAQSIVEYKPIFLPELGHAYARAQRKDEALRILDTLFTLSNRGYTVSCGIALVYNGLGDRDGAFEWLGRAYRGRDMRLIYLRTDPIWDDLRSDPRFIDLMKKLGFQR